MDALKSLSLQGSLQTTMFLCEAAFLRRLQVFLYMLQHSSLEWFARCTLSEMFRVGIQTSFTETKCDEWRGKENCTFSCRDENPEEPQRAKIALNGVKNRYQTKFSNRTSVFKINSFTTY